MVMALQRPQRLQRLPRPLLLPPLRKAIQNLQTIRPLEKAKP
jgi:hypothetical protein